MIQLGSLRDVDHWQDYQAEPYSTILMVGVIMRLGNGYPDRMAARRAHDLLDHLALQFSVKLGLSVTVGLNAAEAVAHSREGSLSLHQSLWGSRISFTSYMNRYFPLK